MDKWTGCLGARIMGTTLVAVGMGVFAGCAADAPAALGYQGTPYDFVQISQLFAKYNYDISIGDGNAWASDFTADGVFQDPSRCAIGREALSDIPGHNPDPAKELKDFHYSTPGPIVYINRDHATVHSTVVLVREAGFGKRGGITITGTYDDKLTRVNGQWKFAYRFVQRPNKNPPIPCAPQAQNGFKFAEWP